MASGQRKAKVLSKDLPAVIKLSDGSFGYLTRHRIISEDRNRFSAWSNVYEVPVFDLNNRPATVDGDISVVGNTIQVTWDDAADRPQYDIFVSFDEEPFFYHGTSPIHSYSFLKKSGASLVSVTIQVESIDKERNDALHILDFNATIET